MTCGLQSNDFGIFGGWFRTASLFVRCNSSESVPHLLWSIPVLLATRPFRRRDPRPAEIDQRLVSRQVDAWFGFGVSDDSSRVVATAQVQGVPSAVFIESNAEIDERLATGEDFVGGYGDSAHGRRFALQHATVVVCQSKWQQQHLRQHFGIDGELIRNPIDPHEWLKPKQNSDRFVLWIGRYDTFHKRPLTMLEVIRKCPEIPFRMVINQFDDGLRQKVLNELPANVTISDYVPFDRMPAMFQRAGIFASTGAQEYEGFPNVLLQAAASHTPIVSLRDFDDFLSDSGAGFSCDESVDAMAERIRDVWSKQLSGNDAVPWNRVDDYLASYHADGAIAKTTAVMIERLLNG